MTRKELNDLKNEKKENFKNGLKDFLEEYKSAQNTKNSFKRHSDNCGNQARKVAEAFCRYIILDSDKPDGQKKNEIEGTLSTLLEKVTRSSNVYIDNSRNRDVLKKRLKGILDIGNEASHDNSVVLTTYDLSEIKNSLLFFSEYLFGVNFSDNMSKEGLNKTDSDDDNKSPKGVLIAKATIPFFNW